MKINIASNEVIHFVGIGGIGMSGLAQIMKNMGFVVQGSDLSSNKNTDRLIKSGIKIYFGTRRSSRYVKAIKKKCSLSKDSRRISRSQNPMAV